MSVKIRELDVDKVALVQVHEGCWVFKEPKWMDKINKLQDRIAGLADEEATNPFLNEIKAWCKIVNERFGMSLKVKITPVHVGTQRWTVEVDGLESPISIYEEYSWFGCCKHDNAENLVSALTDGIADKIARASKAQYWQEP